MTPPERFAAVADRILTDVATGQPVRDPREGAPMPDHILAEARRHHAAVCRNYNPAATDDEIATFWDYLGPAGREGYLRTAEQRLAEEASR
jgi:hypothetical protein